MVGTNPGTDLTSGTNGQITHPSAAAGQDCRTAVPRHGANGGAWHHY
jgi:hypothetical protein